MILSPKYLSEQLLTKVLNSYDWPVPFKLEDEMPFGIIVAFPKSHFLFTESDGGRISVEFLPEDTLDDFMTFTIQDALEVLAPDVNTRGYDFFDIPGPPSLERVEKGIDRCCAFIHAHLSTVIHGDFSWTHEAKRRRIS